MDYHHLTREYAEMVVEKFLDLYSGYRVEKLPITANDFVAIIADSAVFYIKYDVDCLFMGVEENRKWYLDNGVCGVDIEELTPNTVMPQYKHSPFLERVQEEIKAYTGFFVRYARFKGINQNHLPNGMEPHTDYVIEQCPKVRLQERLDSWQGNQFTIVIFEMTDANGNVAYAGDAIKGKVHPFVLKVADKLMTQSWQDLHYYGFGLSEMYQEADKHFVDYFISHRKVRYVKRLQENLKYYSFEAEFFREEKAIRDAVKKRVDEARSGKYASIEKIEYSKPEYRWKTEEYVYKIIKKHYKDHGVIYQHRPFFLHSSIGGQMSYDIFISGLNIAIEYQGKQHFEPIDYFGGEEAFKRVQLRDAEKRKLSSENGIKLVYINYWDEVTPEFVCRQIETAIHDVTD